MATYTFTDLPGSYKIEIIMKELVSALAIYNVIPYVQGLPDGSGVIIDLPDDIPPELVDSIIASHNPKELTSAEIVALERAITSESLATINLTLLRDEISKAATLEELQSIILRLVDYFELLQKTR